MTSYRTRDGVFKFLDGELYRRTTEAGKPVWVHVSISPTWLESKLLNILQEALDERAKEA